MCVDENGAKMKGGAFVESFAVHYTIFLSSIPKPFSPLHSTQVRRRRGGLLEIGAEKCVDENGTRMKGSLLCGR